MTTTTTNTINTTVYETLDYAIGSFALSYLINGDATGLDEEEHTMVDEWFSHATDTWYDTDDNKWVFGHLALIDDSHDEFAYDELTGYYGDVHTVRLHFYKGN